uniref:Uncharacterized protein n=1 Tax=Rhizophora mucronata TaxID=61149 RepID=A0A2P2JEG0_RHIMU
MDGQSGKPDETHQPILVASATKQCHKLHPSLKSMPLAWNFLQPCREYHQDEPYQFRFKRYAPGILILIFL